MMQSDVDEMADLQSNANDIPLDALQIQPPKNQDVENIVTNLDKLTLNDIDFNFPTTNQNMIPVNQNIVPPKIIPDQPKIVTTTPTISIPEQPNIVTNPNPTISIPDQPTTSTFDPTRSDQPTTSNSDPTPKATNQNPTISIPEQPKSTTTTTATAHSIDDYSVRAKLVNRIQRYENRGHRVPPNVSIDNDIPYLQKVLATVEESKYETASIRMYKSIAIMGAASIEKGAKYVNDKVLKTDEPEIDLSGFSKEYANEIYGSNMDGIFEDIYDEYGPIFVQSPIAQLVGVTIGCAQRVIAENSERQRRFKHMRDVEMKINKSETEPEPVLKKQKQKQESKGPTVDLLSRVREYTSPKDNYAGSDATFVTN